MYLKFAKALPCIYIRTMNNPYMFLPLQCCFYYSGHTQCVVLQFWSFEY